MHCAGDEKGRLAGFIIRQEPLIPAAKLGTMRGCITLGPRYEGLCSLGHMGMIGTTSPPREPTYISLTSLFTLRTDIS